jgi:hypothetical protein
MQARILDRLRILEAKIAPKGRHLVFVFDGSGEPAPPPAMSSLRRSRLSTASPLATISTR